MSRRLNDTTSPDTDRPATITGFTYVTRGTNSLTFKWENPNALNVIAVVRLGAINANPIDGIDYTANIFYGSGSEIGSGNYVVYKGSDVDSGRTYKTITIQGLARNNTVYGVKIYSVSADLKYNASISPLSGTTLR